jgi:para-aminobenzoate synthetase component I
MRRKELPYAPDAQTYFERIRHMLWPVLLESGAEYLPLARYDILAADPYVRITAREAETRVTTRSGAMRSAEDPMAVLRAELGAPIHETQELPFTGGALGYIAYDLGRRYERIGNAAAADIEIPDLAMGIYDWAIVIDHLERRTWLVGHGRDPATFDRWDELIGLLDDRSGHMPSAAGVSSFRVVSELRSNLPRDAYSTAFARVKDHIERGDCYQINLTQRFSATVRGDAWHAYRRLRASSPAPYAAFLDYPFGQVLCSSPERFIRVVGVHAQTKPIKGTRPRAETAAEDAANAEALAASAKDRAENVMIVDLLRNDFGKICVPGSVKASRLFAVESFANVHHLVSTVEGIIGPGKDALDLLVGCFPGGSITGAPKISAMQIIDRLEPHRRSIYCGSIGYLGFDGKMDTNIAIRTLLVTRGQVYAWAGGGIVADSQLDAEYQESLDKATAMLDVLASART